MNQCVLRMKQHLHGFSAARERISFPFLLSGADAAYTSFIASLACLVTVPLAIHPSLTSPSSSYRIYHSPFQFLANSFALLLIITLCFKCMMAGAKAIRTSSSHSEAHRNSRHYKNSNSSNNNNNINDNSNNNHRYTEAEGGGGYYSAVREETLAPFATPTPEQLEQLANFAVRFAFGLVHKVLLLRPGPVLLSQHAIEQREWRVKAQRAQEKEAEAAAAAPTHPQHSEINDDPLRTIQLSPSDADNDPLFGADAADDKLTRVGADVISSSPPFMVSRIERVRWIFGWSLGGWLVRQCFSSVMTLVAFLCVVWWAYSLHLCYTEWKGRDELHRLAQPRSTTSSSCTTPMKKKKKQK